MITSLPQFPFEDAVQDSAVPRIQHVNWRIYYSCNYRCPMCTYWSTTGPGPLYEFPADRIQNTVSTLVDAGLRYARLNGGEPTLHPHFGRFVRVLASSGVLVEVVTNASPKIQDWDEWIDDGLSRIQVSIDSHEERAADEHRGVEGAFRHSHKVLEHISAHRPSVTLMLNCVLTGSNYYEGFIRDYTAAFAPYGVQAISFSMVDLKAKGRDKPHQLNGRRLEWLSDEQLDGFLRETDSLEVDSMKSNGIDVVLNPFIPLSLRGNMERRRDLFLKGRLGVHLYPHIPCKQPWVGLSIIENGDCFPCLSTVYTPRYCLGNILRERPDVVFNGARMRHFRQINNRGCNSCCAVCKDHQQRNVQWAASCADETLVPGFLRKPMYS